MDENDAIHALINPYYVINISPDLVGEDEPIVERKQWIAANRRLIGEIGAHEWLEHLLAVLQGDGSGNPDEVANPHDEPEGI